MRRPRIRCKRNYMLPETPLAANSSDLQSLLGAVELRWEQLDPRAKQQAAVLAFGRRANARPDLAVLMQDAAALCAEILRADLSSIGEYDPHRRKLLLRIGVTNIKGASQWLHCQEVELGFAADQLQQSMAGYAITVGSPVVSPNLPADARFKDRFLCGIGVYSAVTVPLHLYNRPLGTLGVYNTSQRPFDEQDAQFVETIAHLLSSSIARVRAEEALAQQTTLMDQLMQQVDTLVFGLDDRGRIVSMNAAAERSSGFAAREICGKTLISALAIPLEAAQFEGYLRRAASQSAPIRFATTMLAKDGSQRQIAWTLKSLGQQGAGGEPTLLLTGADRTAEIVAQTQAADARAEAQRLAEELRRLRQMLAKAEHPVVQEKRPVQGKMAAASEPPAGSGISTEATSQDGLPDTAIAIAAAELEASVARALAGRPAEEQAADQQPFQPQQGVAGHEKRSSPRRQFKYHQLIAPVYGQELPSPKKFFVVACEDISAGGIAFYLDCVPDFHKVVVALGKPPTLAYFRADVVRYSKKQIGDKTMYLVGCRFTTRIPASAIER
jgi:PAS domain S-box-containing protein